MIFDDVHFRQSSGDFKATAWSLDRPDWTGKLKVVTRGGDCCIRLFDKGSNKLHAECPVPAYPGPAVQGGNSIDNLNFGRADSWAQKWDKFCHNFITTCLKTSIKT